MESRKIGFLVLHYLVEDMTRQCVDCLLKTFSQEHIVIAVVDNGSPNGSGQRLQTYYSDTENVHVLCSEENLGFARGNNLGYDYLKANYCLEYMVVMNNDVLIEQKDFLTTLEMIHAEKAFDVLGPDIYCPLTNDHQNPSRLVPLSYEQVKSLCEYLKWRNAHFFYWYCKDLLKKWLKKDKAKAHQQGLDWEQTYDNPVLHGACYIFAGSFVERRDYAFHPGTFLYCEEDILHFECMQAGMKMCYDPRLQISHLEDVATNAVTSNLYLKMRKKTQRTLESALVLLGLHEGNRGA